MGEFEVIANALNDLNYSVEVTGASLEEILRNTLKFSEVRQ